MKTKTELGLIALDTGIKVTMFIFYASVLMMAIELLRFGFTRW